MKRTAVTNLRMSSLNAYRRTSRHARLGKLSLALATILCVACNPQDATSSSTGTTSLFKSNPCSVAGTLQLTVNQSTRVDCTNGGTTLTLAGGGASYLIVPEFATGQGTNSLVSYTMSTGDLAAASISSSRVTQSQVAFGSVGQGASGTLPARRTLTAQHAADRFLRARAARDARSNAVLRLSSGALRSVESNAVAAVPAAGSTRGFHVLSSFAGNGAWKTIGARLAYVGANILLYTDTLSPTNGFTTEQLNNFGHYFDETLDSIAVVNFGAPSDVDQNGHVIMLLSPVVNADSPAATCTTDGYVAGFFSPDDFDGPSDPNSNQGEIFYSIVPDPSATVSCAHSVDDLGLSIPATFLHELQHLIFYSHHVVLNSGQEGASWMDEGLSIVAEELGSTYFEKKCPPPSCRTSAAQLFPDSAQGFVSSFLYDSYAYALVPDTASLTLHTDDQGGFAWRGGDWLLMRWLGDQGGSALYKLLVDGPADGIASIESAAGASFPTLFANFGLALYTDSLPGLPRSTAPGANRFTSRNVKQLWARLFATSGGSNGITRENPVQLFPITADSSVAVMVPGTTTYFRLDTPATATEVTIRFATPNGGGFATALKPQMAVYRLPAGQ